MQLIEKHIVKNNKEYIDLCHKTKCLYNQSLYYWRQSMFKNIEYFTENELTSLFTEFNEENYRALPAQTSQQTIRLLFKNIKSWQRSRDEWRKDPSKFTGRPKIPSYKKRFVCRFVFGSTS